MEEHEIIKFLDLAGLQMIAYQVDEMDGNLVSQLNSLVSKATFIQS